MSLDARDLEWLDLQIVEAEAAANGFRGGRWEEPIGVDRRTVCFERAKRLTRIRAALTEKS